MRNDLQVIQTAIADFNLATNSTQLLLSYACFNFYKVELPDKYKGLPSVWYFAVLSSQEQHKHKFTSKQIIDDARHLISESISTQELPLAVICDVANMYLGAELKYNGEAIFFLDENNLQNMGFQARAILDIPLLVAVRNIFNGSQVPFYINPYTPMQPVTDWRFFGRKKELHEVINSTSNCFIVGARKLGKTSLVMELRNILKKKGQQVYWIQVQNLDSIDAVIQTIAENLSLQEVHKAQKASKLLGVDYLTSILKKLKADKKRMVLILDEIGNAITRDKRNDWNFMGTLRDLSHRGEIRIIATAFQEVIMKQYEDPDGPYVNFGTTIKLEVFSKGEIDELLVHPLDLWNKVKDKNRLNNLIRENLEVTP